MKHLLTLGALLVSTLSLAQFTPYNPDADNDQFVGAQDLLAFLPLFGEDWILDSLVVYDIDDLLPPEWCAWPGNTSTCPHYLVVPQDADVILNNRTSGQTKELILPETPKPLVIFGVTQSSAMVRQFAYYNENQNFTDLQRAKVEHLDPNATEVLVLMPFDGVWWAFK
jgi:hypothetical protein